jgi:hypothetical protein
MNVEIGAESTQFPEKEYINRIFVAVCSSESLSVKTKILPPIFLKEFLYS